MFGDAVASESTSQSDTDSSHCLGIGSYLLIVGLDDAGSLVFLAGSYDSVELRLYKRNTC